MTGREFLLHVAQLFGLSPNAAGKRADELLEMAGLQEAAKRRIGSYSRGMRQRLGLAQALVNRPRVLFLDEPCSALDPIGRRDVLELIHSLRGKVTVFMSTHILADVERVCDDVGIIDHGRLIAHDSVVELRERYARPAFELQFAEPAEPLVQRLKAIPWVAKVEAGEENGSLRVLASDAVKARRELPSILAASGLTLLRYEVVSPTLEDVFLEMVDHRNHVQ
jgi:ABC-2 type transport system ATP-binding protein